MSEVEKKKSGLISLKPGEILFNEADKAASLYIIQKGSIRLYKPKGKGFIELAVLRVGEVIGEMAYFAENDQESKRSCSAQALTSTDIIEISFAAFGKTLAGLNPWFKTIIQTLASRLRKTNAKVKELETNSVSVGHGQSKVGYQYLKNTDVVKLFGSFFLSAKTHGKVEEDGTLTVAKNTISFYATDIFGLAEAKVEEFFNILGLMKLYKPIDDAQGKSLATFSDIKILYSLLIFINKERAVTDDKHIQVSYKCETFLSYILQYAEANNLSQHPKANINLTAVLDTSNKEENLSMDDLQEAKAQGIMDEIMVGNDNSCVSEVSLEKLRELFPIIKFKNIINRLNGSK